MHAGANVPFVLFGYPWNGFYDNRLCVEEYCLRSDGTVQPEVTKTTCEKVTTNAWVAAGSGES